MKKYGNSDAKYRIFGGGGWHDAYAATGDQNLQDEKGK